MPLHSWNGSAWVPAKALSVWNGGWKRVKKTKIWNGTLWILAWVHPVTDAVISMSKYGVVAGESFNVVLTSPSGFPEGASVKFRFTGWNSALLYPAEGSNSITYTGAVHPGTGSYEWYADVSTKGGDTVFGPVSQTVGVGTSASVAGPAWVLSTASGVNSGLANIIKPARFTITLSAPAVVISMSFQLSHEGGAWTQYATWSAPSATTIYDQAFTTTGNWRCRVVATCTGGVTVISPEQPIVCNVKHLYTSVTPTAAPAHQQTVSLRAGHTGDPVLASSSRWWYKWVGKSWTQYSATTNSHDWVAQEYEGDYLDWMWVETFSDGSVINSAPVRVDPQPPVPTGPPVTFSERYSRSTTTTSIVQHCPVYAQIQQPGPVYWDISYDAGATYTTRSEILWAGSDGWSKLSFNPTSVGTTYVRARWSGGQSAWSPLTVTAGGASFVAAMNACLNTINATPSLVWREYGVAKSQPNDGDTIQTVQVTTSDYVTEAALGFAVQSDDGTSCVRPANSLDPIAVRFAGVQAPEYSAGGGKDWGWGPTAYDRVREFVPLNSRIRMYASVAYPKPGYNASQATSCRICRFIFCETTQVHVSQNMLDEGLSTWFTTVDEGSSHPAADGMMARAERASLAGIGIYRGCAESATFSVTFDGSNAYLKNKGSTSRDVGTWFVMDAAGVANYKTIAAAVSGSTTIAAGATLTIPFSPFNNSGQEMASIWLPQTDGEPGDLVCWAARGGTSASMRSITMGMNRGA